MCYGIAHGCRSHSTAVTGPWDSSDWQWPQEDTALVFCLQQINSVICDPPAGSGEPPKAAQSACLIVLIGKIFLLIAKLKFCCFSFSLFLTLPSCMAVKSPSPFPQRALLRQWGMMLGVPKAVAAPGLTSTGSPTPWGPHLNSFTYQCPFSMEGETLNWVQ